MKYEINNLIYAILMIAAICFAGTSAHAQRKYLFKWDQGSGTNMPGWTWNNDVAYGHPGWTLNADGPFGGGKTYMWGYGPRNYELGGYGTNNLAAIVTDDHAPSTSTGGALKIYENPATLDSATHQCTWWMWYDGEGLQKRSITDAGTDRWSFYIKTNGTATASSSSPGAIFHVGTYLTDETACPSYGTGDGAPYEGPGNQHYYHYLFLSPGAWIHVELDRHPTHKRGSHVAGNDPAFILPPDDKCDPIVSHPMHYYEHLHQWYMEIRNAQSQETSFLLDEMYFYSTQDPVESAEPNQNDNSVTSLWVGYWPSTGKWQMGWQDMSFVDEQGIHTNDNTNSTFEIRWSTSPITNNNFNEAIAVQPEWFTSPAATSYPNGVRRADAWSVRVWTQFDLPPGIEDSNARIYFAVKDVSRTDGSTAGTTWPWNRLDGHDAVSPYIHTIDYSIRNSSNGFFSTPVIDSITIR